MHALRKEKLIFVSKPENWNIPIAGRLAVRCCFRTIDRENARNALRTIQDCARLLDEKAGPVVIYPEGTRSKTGELLPFHNGVFKIAICTMRTAAIGNEVRSILQGEEESEHGN